jgi:hypothetical protein
LRDVPTGKPVALRAGMDDDTLLSDLREAIHRLADAIGDHPPTAQALGRLADDLPQTRPSLRRALAARLPRNPSRIQPLLWRALDRGLLDGRRFDAAMLARSRAQRALERRYSPPEESGSPSDSESTAAGAA